ncbi:MAG: hypothetical protein ABIH68_05885 [bacterium]
MSKSDKIWLSVGIPGFILMILFICNVFTTDRSIAGKKSLKNDKYAIFLDGGHFESCWRNFYKIRKESSADALLINVQSGDEMIYAMASFKVVGVDPRKVTLSGAAFSERDKYSDGIRFTIRVGSRKNIMVRVSENG